MLYAILPDSNELCNTIYRYASPSGGVGAGDSTWTGSWGRWGHWHWNPAGWTFLLVNAARASQAQCGIASAQLRPNSCSPRWRCRDVTHWVCLSVCVFVCVDDMFLLSADMPQSSLAPAHQLVLSCPTTVIPATRWSLLGSLSGGSWRVSFGGCSWLFCFHLSPH